MKTKAGIKKMMTGIILFIQSLYAQYSLRGYVKDAHNQSLPGVVVYVPSIEKGSVSGLDGYFEIPNLASGVYVVEFKLLGYQSVSKKVHLLFSDVTINVVMPTSAREIDEVIVTTVADVMLQRENPMPIKSVNFDNLNKQASNNLIEAIGKKDNVWALTTGPGIAKPIIRGLSYNRVMVLVNGLRQEGQQWGDEHGVEIDQYAIAKAEIIKGPGSIMFGSDALGGLVNFIPYRIQKDGWNGKYLGLYQSNHQMIANSAIVQYKKGNYGFFLQGTQKDAGNYQNAADGKVFGTGFNERDVSAAFQWSQQRLISHFYTSVYTEKLNMPEGDRDSSGRFLKFIKLNDTAIGQVPISAADLSGYKFFIPYQHISHYRFQNYSVFQLKKADKIISHIGYQYNIRDEYGPDKLLEKDTEEMERGNLSMHLHTFPFQLRFLKVLDSTQMLSIGTSGMYQKNVNKGEELLIPDYFLMDVGGFLYYQKTWANWVLAAGTRWDIRYLQSETMYLDSRGKRFESTSMPPNGSIKFQSFSKQFNNFSATAGMVYNGWKEVVFKFNIARGFRAPNISELASHGAHEGTVRYEYGYLNLKPEVSTQVDMGLIVNKEHGLFEITPFVHYTDHYIYYRKLSSLRGGDSLVVQNGESLWAFTYNQGQALIYGGELHIDVHPHPLDWLHVETNFSYLQGGLLNQTDSTRYLPFFPPSRWTNEIRGEWSRLTNGLKKIFFSLEAMYVFPQDKFFRAYHTETYTPDYTLLNASAGIGFRYWKERQMQVIVGVNNLLDKVYQDHLNRLKYVRVNPTTGKMGLYNMGRNIFIRLIVDF